MCGVISLGWNLSTGQEMAGQEGRHPLTTTCLSSREGSLAAMTADQLGM